MPKPTRGLLLSLEQLTDKPLPVNDTSELLTDINERTEAANKPPASTEKPLPVNDTQPIVDKDPENPDPENEDKPEELKNIVATESDGKPLPVNDTQELVTEKPENPHPEGKVEELKNVVEKGKETESGIATESEASLPRNDTDPIVDKDPQNPNSEGKVVEVDLVEEGKESEAGIVILEEALEEIENIVLNIDEGQAVTDELDRYREIVDGATETGEMNATASEILNTALESLFDRVGYEMSKQRAVPALESDASSMRMAANCRVALEAIDDGKKSIAQGIVNAIKAFIAKLAEFAKSMLSTHNQTKEQVNKVKELIKSGSTYRTGELKNETLARQFTFKGAITHNLIQDLRETIKNVSLANDGLHSVLQEQHNFIPQLKDGDASEAKLSALLGKFDAVYRAIERKPMFGTYAYTIESASVQGKNFNYVHLGFNAPAVDTVKYPTQKEVEESVALIDQLVKIGDELAGFAQEEARVLQDFQRASEGISGAAATTANVLLASARYNATALMELFKYVQRLIRSWNMLVRHTTAKAVPQEGQE